MMPLGTQEILQLAPDEGSAKAAMGLVIPGKWPRLEFDDQALWGECQGSGSKPYQVQVDKAGPAFRCTCPSRKFPCKHGLALLLLMAQNPGSFAAAGQPTWVTAWISSRRARADKQEAKAVAAESGAGRNPDAADAGPSDAGPADAANANAGHTAVAAPVADPRLPHGVRRRARTAWRPASMNSNAGWSTGCAKASRNCWRSRRRGTNWPSAWSMRSCRAWPTGCAGSARMRTGRPGCWRTSASCSS